MSISTYLGSGSGLLNFDFQDPAKNGPDPQLYLDLAKVGTGSVSSAVADTCPMVMVP